MKITNDSYKIYSSINFKNVYLNNNRIMPAKYVDRYIKKISRHATVMKIADSVENFIKRIFNK